MGNQQASSSQLNEFKSDAFVLNYTAVKPSTGHSTRNVGLNMKSGTLHYSNKRTYVQNRFKDNCKGDLIPKYDRKDTRVKWATPAPNPNNLYFNAVQDMNIKMDKQMDPVL